MLTPTLSIVLFKGKTLADDRHPIMMQVYDGETRRFALGMRAFQDEWNEDAQDFVADKELSKNLRSIKVKAQRIFDRMIDQMIEENRDFSFAAFKQKVLNKKETSSHPKGLLAFLEFYMELLLERERLGDKNHYQKLYNQLKEFGVSRSLRFTDIDKMWLEKFETYLSKRVNPRTGKRIKKISIRDYIKHLRTLFNKAIEFGVTTHYPFRNQVNKTKSKQCYSFSHLKSPRISKSLSDEMLEKFTSFDWRKHKKLAKVFHRVMCIYYMNGIPIADASRLTKTDIFNNAIHFGRIKTHTKVPEIPLIEKLEFHLSRLEPYTDGYHLLDILHKDRHFTEQKRRNRVEKIKTLTNAALKKIADIQGIPDNLTTYTFRHTIARKVLEQYGIYFLNQLFGHKSMDTTAAYVGSLTNKEAREKMTVLHQQPVDHAS